MEIKKIESLPSTNNAWGFGGAYNKKKYIMKNGDIWITGIACYRHLPEEKYIQLKVKGENFNGGLSADLDELLHSKPETYIKNYYDKQRNKKIKS